MSFALLIIGIVLMTSAIRGTQDYLVLMLRADFTGANNFTYWIVALILVGAIGYVEKLKPVSDGLLVLILIALFLTRGSPAFPGGGFFTQFTRAIGTTTGAGGSGLVVNFGSPGSTNPFGGISPTAPQPYPIGFPGPGGPIGFPGGPIGFPGGGSPTRPGVIID